MEPESKVSIARRRQQLVKEHTLELAVAGGFVFSLILGDKISGQADNFIFQLLGVALPVCVLSIWLTYYYWFIRRLSEFEQTIATQALAIAFGLVVWIVTIWGICIEFIQAPAPIPIMIAPLAATIYAVIRFVLYRYYR